MFSILFVINCGQMSYFCFFVYFFVFNEKPFKGNGFWGGGRREDDEDDDDDDDNVDDTNSLELTKNLITDN